MKKNLLFIVFSLLIGYVSAQSQVRSSMNPIVGINPLPAQCSANDTAYATIGYDPNSTIVLQHIYSGPLANGRNDSLIFIPDGPSCPPGYLNSYITFTQFAAGQTLGLFDLQSVCVSIEHSYSGDLGFELICPDGQSVVLDGNDHSGSSFLGQANDIDGAPACSPAANIPGTPWFYCWSTYYPQQGSLNVLDGQTSPVPATDTINHTNYLTPDNSFMGLAGCPLNGIWTMQVTDDWQSDNGYLFGWELNFDPSVIQGGQSNAFPIDTVIWSGQFINNINDSTIRIVPDSAGAYMYSVTVIDTSGSSFDTTFNYSVVKSPYPQLGHDTTLCCETLNYTLDAGIADNYEWSTGNITRFQPVTSGGIYWVKAGNVDSVLSLVCYSVDTVQIAITTCTGINEFDASENIFTLSPNPAKEIIKVQLEQNISNAEIKIYSLLGQTISTLTTSNALTSIDVSDYPNGVYIVEVKTDNNISRKKFVKE